MAITITNPDHGPMAGAGFFINTSSADISGCGVLKTGVHVKIRITTVYPASVESTLE